ncbi:radical SAM protein [Tenacibaculum retecalamus]|uniref:radical SAM protein n=1 Tax=Tenacibaculum retecalamus TaxID=3018315 RepID=UPI0023D95177|nr:radical SAM protein [Tenacibaculum retecalamus]WBX71656.1 radical SAM protein [Tenacibaculum retecalamus]
MKSSLKNINKKLFPSKYQFSPEWIVLGVNNVCNLHCKMCDVGNKNLESNFAQNLVGTHPINMPLNLIKKIIDQTSKYYPSSKLAYAFTEPLVYPHLLESLEYANKKQLYTTITTNALTLKHKAKKLVESGINEVYVSLDGPQEIHNEIRGHKKSFQKAIEGIEELLNEKRKPLVKVICAITEWNVGAMHELLDSLKHLPIQDIGFMHTQFITKESAELHENSPWNLLYPASDSNVDLIDFENMDLDSLLNEIETIKNSTYPFNVYFSPEITSKENLELYYLQTEKIIGKLCNAVYTSIMIKSDGSVIPAHGRCYNLNLGNMYDQSLKGIWSSGALKKLRTDLHKAGGLFPACSRCCSAF